jgi:hypothetical protein
MLVPCLPPHLNVIYKAKHAKYGVVHKDFCFLGVLEGAFGAFEGIRDKV